VLRQTSTGGARQNPLDRTAAEYYSGETTAPRTARERAAELRHHSRREVAHGAALSLFILLPIGFLVYATRVRDRVGLNRTSALGLLVAVSLVLAASVYRRQR
jgi:hypothetical protein